jgi:hypothetical protein
MTNQINIFIVAMKYLSMPDCGLIKQHIKWMRYGIIIYLCRSK